MKRIVVAGFSAAVVAVAVFAGGARNPSLSPSFQYVVTGEGDVRGMSTDTAHPGSRQLVHFSNDNVTIAASIEVEEIRGGVALVRVRARSYPGRVDRETSEKELQSARSREYTYVPMESLSLPIEGGGMLSLVGAVSDEAGNLSKPMALHSLWPQMGQISLMAPALLRDDRVLVNLKQGAAAYRGVRGNPAIALFAAPEDLFIFALEPFEGATACEVLFGRAEFRLEGNNYTLFAERPILGEDHQSKIWVLHVNKYIPSGVEKSWLDRQSWMRPGMLSDLLSELKVGESVPHR
jgi:hypothetical protein